MKNKVILVVFLSIFLQHFGVIGLPYIPSLFFQLTEKVAYFLYKYQFFNFKMQNMQVTTKEVRWYYSKTMTTDNSDHRNVFIRNKLTTSLQVSCSTSRGLQIGTLTLQPEYSYFFRFEDDYWHPESYSCVATYSSTRKLSFDAYKGKAPIAYQNGFEIREGGIYLINGNSSNLNKGDIIVFLGIGSKLTNGFALPQNYDYRVIQFENRKNEATNISCKANDGNGKEFTVGGRGYTVPKGGVYKFAIEAVNFHRGFVECVVGAIIPENKGIRVYGEDSYGQYKRGSEYYFIDENDTVTFEKIVNNEGIGSEITKTDPNLHFIHIQNQIGNEIYVHCWGKQNQSSPQINVSHRNYRLESEEIYRFSIPVESFKDGEFWCDVGGIYPNSRFVRIYGYDTASRSSHFYGIRSSFIVYERVNGFFG